MKKLVFALMLLLTALFCLSCGSKLLSEQEANDYIDATEYVDSGVRTTFRATVSDIGKYSLTVIPDEESSEARSSDLIVVSVSASDPVIDGSGNAIALSDLAVGDRVVICYNGMILESYPARISQCYEVKKIDE
ncbi:MAG: hypothetical protein ACI3XR_03395 [Eubacteriales bacterium]